MSNYEYSEMHRAIQAKYGNEMLPVKPDREHPMKAAMQRAKLKKRKGR